ncbi:hypothetical protein D3C87_676320 [compost metagenome]
MKMTKQAQMELRKVGRMLMIAVVSVLIVVMGLLTVLVILPAVLIELISWAVKAVVPGKEPPA